MATDDADSSGTDESGEAQGGGAASAGVPARRGESPVVVGEYTWVDFLREHGHDDAVTDLYPAGEDDPAWDAVDLDPEAILGFHPDDVEGVLAAAAGPKAEYVELRQTMQLDPGQVPVTKDVYTWEQFKHQYYYKDGEAPTSGGEIVPFDSEEYLGFDGAQIEGRLADVGNIGAHLADVVDERTVTTLSEFGEDEISDVSEVDAGDVESFDEDEFFTDEHGNTTLVNRYDLEKTVPEAKKSHFREIYRYWVNEPYAFVVIFHSVKENEKKYYAVEPYLNEIEADLMDFLTGKLRNAIKYADDEVVVEGTEEDRKEVIERETRRLLRRYDLYSGESGPGLMAQIKGMLGMTDEPPEEHVEGYEEIEARPEPTVLAEDPETINRYQVEKLLYYLKRNFIGYERIDPIKEDTVNVEDISCDGYNSPVFVYHSEYEQIITNIYHGEGQLDDFVVKLAQRSGKGISKRRPQVDATLPDGSRAQLTLGKEVSDHGTNYTIRQFKEVPFTPLDEINWNTLSLEQTAFLWLCIENDKSMIIAGGTATGKTSLLNALSLFIPSNEKIVSIEDTREVELPQRNWVASVTRPSFGEDDSGDVDEFDLLEAALRQRPDYIVMGEVRGEEGRDLFQVMSTGHTSYSTFHADSVGEVLKRFTTDPINVSKTMFTALDLVAIQTRTRVGGNKVVRNKNLTEINHYDAENDEINVQDIYQWQAETDEFLKSSDSNTLETIKFDRGWSHDRLQEELFKREVILAYLIENGLKTYTQVAATIQGFINDPETILALIANDQLERSLEDLREMESILLDVDEDKEKMAPRPDPNDETRQLCIDILERAGDSLLGEYRGKQPSGLAGVIQEPAEELPEPASEVVQVPEEEEIEFTGEVSDDAIAEGTFDIDPDEASAGAEAQSGGTGAEERPALEAGRAEGAEAAGSDPSQSSGTADQGGEGPEWLFGDDDEEDDPFGFSDSGGGDPDEGRDESGGSGLAFGSDGDDGTGGSSGGGLAFGSDGDDATSDGADADGGETSEEGAFGFGGDSSEPDESGAGREPDAGGESDAFGFGAGGAEEDDRSDPDQEDAAFGFGDGEADSADPNDEGDDPDDGEETDDEAGDFAFGDGGQVTEGGDEFAFQDSERSDDDEAGGDSE